MCVHADLLAWQVRWIVFTGHCGIVLETSSAHHTNVPVCMPEMDEIDGCEALSPCRTQCAAGRKQAEGQQNNMLKTTA